MKQRCLICADDIAAGELLQHVTGDYHTACFNSIAAAGVTIERWSANGDGNGHGDGTRCSLCRDGIAPRTIVVRPSGLVVHLHCFFNPPRTARKSVGAAAWVPTLIEQSVGLARCACVLRRESMRAQARSYALRERHRAVMSIRRARAAR